jgi:hypothetical protein
LLGESIEQSVVFDDLLIENFQRRASARSEYLEEVCTESTSPGR